MRRFFKVGRWGNHAQSVLLDLEQLSYRNIKDSDQKEFHGAGTVRYFIGGPIFLLREDDAWFIWIPEMKEPIPLEDLRLSSRLKLGVFKELTLEYGSFKKSFSQLHMTGLLEKIDPTFDELDRSTEDFIHHLISKQKEALNRRQSDLG